MINIEKRKAYQREYHKKWNIKNKEKYEFWSNKYAKSPKRKEYMKNYNTSYYIKNKDKIISYRKLPQNKKLIKIRQYTNDNFYKDNDCGVCHSKENLKFHHWVYKLPVERKHFSTVCNECHSIIHGAKSYD